MRLISLTILLVVSICLNCYASFFTYKEPLPETIFEGSWNADCTIRLDFERLLADLTKCTILDSAEYFTLYDKDDFFIGTFYHQDDYEYKIKGGYQYISMKFNFSSSYLFNKVSVKDIRYVRLHKPVWIFENLADEANVVDFIKCKKKNANVFRIDHPDYEYACKVQYECPKGHYAVDKMNCAELPKNARRLPQEGFECLKGFDLYEDNDTSYCHKPYACPKGYYAVDSMKCDVLPKNAKRLPQDGFVCLDGYVYMDKFDGYVYMVGDCVKKTKCNKDEKYDEATNECYNSSDYTSPEEVPKYNNQNLGSHSSKDIPQNPLTCDGTYSWDNSTKNWICK